MMNDHDKKKVTELMAAMIGIVQEGPPTIDRVTRLLALCETIDSIVGHPTQEIEAVRDMSFRVLARLKAEMN